MPVVILVTGAVFGAHAQSVDAAKAGTEHQAFEGGVPMATTMMDHGSPGYHVMSH